MCDRYLNIGGRREKWLEIVICKLVILVMILSEIMARPDGNSSSTINKVWTSEHNTFCFWWGVKFVVTFLHYFFLYHNIHWRENIASNCFGLQMGKEMWPLTWFHFLLTGDPKHTKMWDRPKLKKFIFILTGQAIFLIVVSFSQLIIVITISMAIFNYCDQGFLNECQ